MPLWRKAHFEVKMVSDEKVHAVVARLEVSKIRKLSVSEHFWKLNVEEVDAAVARSARGSENAENTKRSDHLWTSRCRPDVKKIASCGSAKHIGK